MRTHDSFLLPHVLNYEDDGLGWPPPAASLDSALKEYDDENLLELVKHGTKAQCKAAFTEIYDRHHRDVWYFTKSKGLSDADAKGVFCEVWLVAIEKLPKFEWGGKPIKSWLITTANNKLSERFRAITETPTSLEDVHSQALSYIDAKLQLDKSSPPEPPPDSIEAQADRLLMQALPKLKPIDRKIIKLMYFKGKNATEVGQILGKKSGTVRQRKRRALEKLQRFFEAEGVK